jgi:hypothetical protein
MFPVVCCASNGPAIPSTMSIIVTMILRIFLLSSVFLMTGSARPRRAAKQQQAHQMGCDDLRLQINGT